MTRETVRILLVEDDEGLRELIREELEDQGFHVIEAGSAEQAAAHLQKAVPDLVLSDLRLPGADGIALLGQVRRMESPPSFIIVTAFGTVARAVEALRAGADDFLTKPLDLDHLRLSVARTLETRTLKQNLKRYRDLLESDTFHGMIAQSEGMEQLFDQIRQVAHARGPVLIAGESGTGKELVARAVHEESRRAGKPFIAINCAGIPADLLESEFFGHARGAFTGAVREREGLFVDAHHGTLFLDEISEMPVELQAKLLRVLEDGRIRPVGGGRQRTVDVRILAATNQNIEAEVRENRFREDLFYRLETFTLRIPPLRDRGDDLELLAGYFLNRDSLRMGKEIEGISARATRQLRAYPFPGNVRELKNAIERAVAFCHTPELELGDLPRRIREHKPVDDPGALPISFIPPERLQTDPLPTLAEIERLYIRWVLEQVGGNKRRAAPLLGIARRTLYRHLENDVEET
jgi:DNA-binding NtrC family response regulator